MMLRCALPVNALSSFIQRAAVKRPNKDQINTEEARREGRVSVQRWGQPGTWKINKIRRSGEVIRDRSQNKLLCEKCKINLMYRINNPTKKHTRRVKFISFRRLCTFLFESRSQHPAK